MSLPPLKYLHRYQVNIAKWDNCINKSANGLIYAYSLYLDIMAKEWDALVMGDYEVVMPLTWNKKWGIHYLYQPFCTAQLGVFSPGVIDTAMVAHFISSIPRKFRFIDIDLNEANRYESEYVIKRKNYVLNLTGSYSQAAKNYNRHAQRKLRKATEADLRIIEGIDIENVAMLSYNMMLKRGRVAWAVYEQFIYLFEESARQGWECNTLAAIDKGGEVISSLVYFVKNGRVYSILAGNSPQSGTYGGFYLVLDHLINKFSGTGYLLDFEGSDIPGIAFLFECLGAQVTYYPHLLVNKLPLLIRWLK